MKISIITPIYKGEKYVSHLFDMVEKNVKVLHKKYHDVQVEYILVNDYPQESWFKQNTYFSKYVDIILLENPVNSGIHQSRINALKRATGRYILFLDQDDEIDKNTLLSQLEAINGYKSLENEEVLEHADMVISNGYRKYSYRVEPLYSKTIALKLTKNESMYIYGTDMILSPGQCLIKREAIPEEWINNIMKVNGCDDFFLWLLMLQNGCKFTINEEKLYYHTENEKNYSASSENMTSSFVAMCDILEENKLIDKWKVRVLRRRYKVKVKMKSRMKVNEKIRLIFENLDIIYNTIIYKCCGYH